MRIGEAIIRDTTRATKAWTKHREQVIRSRGRATWTPPTRAKKATIKDVAWRIMPEAYAKAAGQVGMAAPRQVFYAARPLILDALDLDPAKLSSVYFTQTLLPDYINAHPTQTAGWDLLWDDRGHFQEPHTHETIGLGTLAVRRYLTGCDRQDLGVARHLTTEYPTSGPQHRFRNVLLIEKEGFLHLFQQIGIDTRYDLAIMSSKGMNTTACRQLVEGLSDVRVFVLHDFDAAGFSILGTLTRSNRRHQFTRQANIVDLGIRLEDVDAEGLASEPCAYRGDDPKDNLWKNGATAEERTYLVDGKQRVEINAFTSDHLIAWLERKLQAHGVKKVVPDDATLVEAYRRAVLIHTINARIDTVHEEARAIAQNVDIPTALGEQVQQRLKTHPTLSWDAVIADLAEGRR